MSTALHRDDAPRVLCVGRLLRVVDIGRRLLGHGRSRDGCRRLLDLFKLVSFDVAGFEHLAGGCERHGRRQLMLFQCGSHGGIERIGNTRNLEANRLRDSNVAQSHPAHAGNAQFHSKFSEAFATRR